MDRNVEIVTGGFGTSWGCSQATFGRWTASFAAASAESAPDIGSWIHRSDRRTAQESAARRTTSAWRAKNCAIQSRRGVTPLTSGAFSSNAVLLAAVEPSDYPLSTLESSNACLNVSQVELAQGKAYIGDGAVEPLSQGNLCLSVRLGRPRGMSDFEA